MKYCLDNDRNAVLLIRILTFLLLKSIFDLSDVDVLERKGSLRIFGEIF